MEFRIKDVGMAHPAMQFSLPLISNHDGEQRCIGTAFPVAPGLAITAEHVVDDWVNYQEKKDGYRRSDTTFSVLALQWHQDALWPWVVDAIYTSKSADIAFLCFAKPSWRGTAPGQIQPPSARLSFNPPDVGKEVRIFGFPESRIENNVLIISPSECVARVRQIAWEAEGNARPYSHVELDGEMLGGMSGGPCFDRDWNVVGVNSRGWTFLDAPPISYMALLWPAMNVEIDLFKTGRFPAGELFKKGPARAVGYRRIHVTSEKKVMFARIDPESLAPIGMRSYPEPVEDALDFAASSAHKAMVAVQEMLAAAQDNATALDSNTLHRHLRAFFWELETTLNLAMHVVAIRAGFKLELPLEWEAFVEAIRAVNDDDHTRDELAHLDLAWNGVVLFEARMYAQEARASVLCVYSVITTGNQVEATMLGPCRRGGYKTTLPEGLEAFYSASRAFVGRLLRLARRNANPDGPQP